MKRYKIMCSEKNINLFEDNRSFKNLSYAKKKCLEASEYMDTETLYIKEIEFSTLLELEKKLQAEKEKIDELEKRLSALDNTGMIGSSPAQFMEKVRALESKLAKAMEALRVINSYPETLVFADVFTVTRKTLEEIGEQE